MHSAALEPCLDHQLIGTLDHPTADRPALCLKARILHLRHAFIQIGQILRHDRLREMRGSKGAQVIEHALWAVVFEFVQLPRLPGLQAGVLRTQDGFADWAESLCRVWEIQNTCRVRTMKIKKALNPFGPITHGCGLVSCLEVSAIEFTEREALKQLGFRHPREVGMAVRRDNWFSVDLCRFTNLAHHEGFDFGPVAMQQRHECAIDTEEQFVWPILDLWPVALDPFDFGQLYRFIGYAHRFSQPLGGRFAHTSLRKGSQQGRSSGKRHPNTQMGQMVLQKWCELARKQG